MKRHVAGHLRRRDFLKAAGFATGAFCLAANVESAGGALTGPAKITFGYSLYGMKDVPLVRALAVCAEIGYDAVELAALPGWPGNPDVLTDADRSELRAQLQARRLSLSAVMDGLPPQSDDTKHRAQLERLRKVCDLATELSPTRKPVVETILGGKPGEWPALRDMMAARLRDWARVAESEQIIVAVKPHRLGALNTPTDAVWLMEQVGSPWVRIGYDYSHFVFRDLPQADTLRALLPLTGFVHVKDAVQRDGKVQFALPGESTEIDYRALFRQLRDGGYQGCVCVEVSGQVQASPGYEPISAARRSYDNLLPALVDVGWRAG